MPALPTAGLLDGLDDRQVAAVTSEARALRILAGAGSGKTRVLTRRIAHRAATGDADPRRVLALTFTRRAALELGERIGALGIHDLPTAGTFHAVAWAQLRSWWADRGRTPPRILRSKPSFVRRVLREGEVPLTRTITAEVDWAAARLVAPDDYVAVARAAGRPTPVPPPRLAQILTAYTAEKRRRGMVDFDDLLGMCAAALERDPAFGSAQRWRFQHVFVDEFQDLNPLQFRLLRAWLPAGDDVDLCVVGDPNQAIYGWNGADNTYLLGFDDHFPGGETVALDRNYRSSPLVVDVATAVLGPSAAQRPVRPPGPVPTVAAHADEAAEAAAVTEAVREAARVPGRRWSAQAVLVRTHAQAVIVARALEEAGVPVHLRTRDGIDDAASGEDPQADGWGRDRLGDPRRPEAREDAVDVATFHAAKGLEWPVVHVAGVEDGLVPHASASSPDAVEEERRLLYVAVTRAERELHLTWARARSFRGRVHQRRPSPWIDPVSDALSRMAPPPAAVTTAPAARVRAPVAPAPRDDSPVDRLRAWRDTQARAARVAPQVVMSDDALDAVARALPATAEELAAVVGVGPVRAARFGEALLAIVAADPTHR